MVDDVGGVHTDYQLGSYEIKMGPARATYHLQLLLLLVLLPLVLPLPTSCFLLPDSCLLLLTTTAATATTTTTTTTIPAIHYLLLTICNNYNCAYEY